jgi:hypothetical protein
MSRHHDIERQSDARAYLLGVAVPHEIHPSRTVQRKDLADMTKTRITKRTKPATCIWNQVVFWETSFGFWETSCGQDFNIMEGETPSGCGMKFCCFCGKPIEESLEKEQE